MDNETNHKLPVNATWGDAINLIADLIGENKSYRDGWATEVIAQAKRNTLHWVIAFWLTLAALVATNAYWIYVFQSYDYASQNGDGINNINDGSQGDVINEPEGTEKEEWKEPGI